MKNKIIPYLQYCLECGSKNKRIKNVFLDKNKFNKKLKYYKNKNYLLIPKSSREFYHKHYKCIKCNNIIIFFTCVMYNFQNVGELEFHFTGNRTFFRYVFSSKELLIYNNCPIYKICKIFDFKDAIKYISRYLQNQIFQ